MLLALHEGTQQAATVQFALGPVRMHGVRVRVVLPKPQLEEGTWRERRTQSKMSFPGAEVTIHVQQASLCANVSCC